MTFHPWRRVRDTPEISVKLDDTGEAVSCFNFRKREATVAVDGLQAARRCDINHEYWHHKRGPLPIGSTKADRDAEERTIEILSARELISVYDLGEAMAWTSDMAEVADELWVDLPCLWARLEGLTVEERRYIDERVYKVTGDDHETTGHRDLAAVHHLTDRRMRR